MKADPEDSITSAATQRRSSAKFLCLRRRQCFTVFVLLFCFSSQCSAAGNSQIPSDVAALLSIKASLRDPRGILSSWNEGAIATACTGAWVGVKCNSGNVVALHLPSKGLVGTLSSDVGNLPYLRQLSLHHNGLTGSIPSTISSLRNLRGLYLFQNFFTGAIPATLSPVLQAMDLSHNQLSGAIPDSLASSSALLRRLDLSFNNLSSSIPESLTSLTRLQDLSLSHNSLSGSIPPQLSQLTLLRTIDLSSNSLSGSFPSLSAATHAIPASVIHFAMSRRASSSPSSSQSAVLPSLIVLNFSRNDLTGPIPAQIGNLPSLLVLDLSHNNFSGSLPPEVGNVTDISTIDISFNNISGELPSSLSKLSNLTSFNCSFNSLTGAVPKFSHSMSETAFLGNIGLCGFSPSSTCPLSSPATAGPSTNSSSTQQAEAAAAAGKKKFSPLSIVFIVIGVVIVLFLVLCVCSLLFLCCCRRSEVPSSGYLGDKAGSGAGAGKKEGEIGGKLVHFEGSLGFAADDLLCATAEVLGKSTYGTVYKATLEDGKQVAVKRLREGIVKSQKDFEAEVAVLGAIRHPNLLALRAYYWGPKDEKLLIFDFMQGGSLAAFIHARGPETPLTWQTRMNIAMGAARGLAHLHIQEKTVHGNLTSSNILMDGHLNAKLSDFGLSRLMTPAANSNVITTAGSLGYRAPELTKLKKASPKSDVYSFGIVLLELLTGKAPGEGPSSAGETTMDLPDWVASIVKQEWTHEVFDVELMKGRPPGDEELINTLQLAMACVKLNPMERPDIEDILRHLEQIRPDLRQ